MTKPLSKPMKEALTILKSDSILSYIDKEGKVYYAYEVSGESISPFTVKGLRVRGLLCTTYLAMNKVKLTIKKGYDK